ncbi:hypothetical protein DXG03_008919 [Asterophora parasitica]|uniref:Protein kinase domain-containing protein n=1 Tax=Asterophora parasitica TaxID=117018 RepID=A0A9P7KH86_9AGAR|nr:hypothetical protein DXG03_008919 [Asterophora parasitica]
MVTPQCLGSGSFATVHLALDPVKRRQVACKSIRTKREHEVGQVMKEVRILMTIRHPNINEIYDTEANKNYIHIFLQLCTGGDLFTYVTNHPSLHHHLCEAEANLLKPQEIPKPENILLHAPGPYPRILIADFGLARPNAHQETFNVCGTVSYLPPEGVLALDIKHLGYVGLPADCWSAGIILFIMLCHIEESRGADGTQPSQRYVNTEARLKARIIDGRVEFQSHLWNKMPDGSVDASEIPG